MPLPQREKIHPCGLAGVDFNQRFFVFLIVYLTGKHINFSIGLRSHIQFSIGEI
jgi:hypothetical protein